MSRFGGIPLNTSRFGGIPVVDDLEDDVNALFDIESGYRDYDDQGNPITSPKGAMFKSQVTPATAADPGFGITPAAEQTPEEFNRVGRDYYAKMLERYDGDKNKAVAAYNAGPTAVDRALTQGDNWLAALPEETQNHVRKFNERLGASLEPPAPTHNTGQSMEPWEPSIIDKIKGFFTPSKDASSIELGAREIAAERGTSVDDAYKAAGGSRPSFTLEGSTSGMSTTIAESGKIGIESLKLSQIDDWPDTTALPPPWIPADVAAIPGNAAKFWADVGITSDEQLREVKEGITSDIVKNVKKSQGVIQSATPESLAFGDEAARGAIQSVAMNAPGLLISALTRSPAPALAAMYAMTEADSYAGARAEGKEPEQAKLYSRVDGIIEVVTELLPTKRLVSIFGVADSKTLRDKVIGYLGAEQVGEQLATLGQSMNAVVNELDAEMAAAVTNEERVKIQAERQALTALSTLIASGAQGAVASSPYFAKTLAESVQRAAMSKESQIGKQMSADIDSGQFVRPPEQVAAERFAAGTRATGGLEINTSTPADIVRSGGTVEPEKDVTGVIASQMQPSAAEATVKWLSEDGIEYPVQIVRQDVPVEGDDRPHALVNYNGVEALVPTEQLSGVSATPQRGSVNFTPADSPTLEAGLQPIIIPEVTDVSMPVTPVVGSEGSSQLRSTVSLGGMGDSGSNNVVGRNLGDVPGVNATPGRQTSFVPGGAVQQPASVDGVRGQAIDNEWSSFAPESGTLSIPRTEMPQVKAEHRGAMVNFLKARGIESEQSVVPAASLKPTQAEFSEVKVQSAKDFTQGDRAILVSSDGHILDGHHQWMAKRDNGEDVRVITLNAPINELMEQVKEFPSSEFATEGVMKDGQVTPALPDSSVDGVGSQTERFRQVGQQAIDADAARRREASPFQLTPAAPRVDQKVTQIGTALSDALGLKIPVVAFDSADPKSPHGFAVAGTAFVNVNGAVHPTPNTTLHEMKHVIEGIAQVENQMGLEGTAAQNFTRQIDSLFDEMSDDGKRSYLSNLLHTEELRALDDTARESRIQELLVDKTGTLRSEMIADFLGNRATDRQFWRDLANQDPEGFQGFVQKWLDILDNLIDMLRGRKTANKQESSEVDNYVKDLNKAKMVVRDAMVEFRRRAKEEYPDQVMDAYRGILADRVDSKRQDLPDRKVPDNLVDTASLDNALKMAKDSHFKNIIELKDALQTAVLADAKAAKVDLRSYGPNTRDYVVKVGVKDAVTALKSNPNAIGWYDDNVTRALGVLSQIHPELSTDVDAKFAFTYALAVTSNGLRVEKNFELAERAYRRYKNDDVMPSDIGIGDAVSQINKGLALFNVLKAEQGIEQFRENMLTEMTVRQVQQVFDIKVAGELMDTKVRGAAILGPKIGNGFFANLNGVFDQLTMDRWLMRTFGRWTGTLLDRDPVKIRESRTRVRDAIRDLKQNPPAAKAFENAINRKLYVSDPDGIAIQVKKASMVPAKRNVMDQTPSGDELRRAGNRLAVLIDGQKEAPANGNERNFIRDAFSGILADVRQQGYDKLTMADLQAAYWYAERRLYDQARSKEDVAEGYSDDDAPDYYNAALSLAKKLGVEVTDETRDSTGSTERGADAIGPQLSRSRRQAFQDKFLPNRPGSPGNENVKAYKDPVNGLYEITDEFRQTVSDTGLTPVNLVEMPSTPESASKFEQAIRQAKTQSKFGAAVYVYPVDDYQRMRLFQSEDGLAGFAIKPDGDIVSVYSNGGGKVHSMLALAVEQGGTMLDAFDTILPELYSLNGFRETSREPWNDEYRPEGWDKAVFADYNNGEPDVVYMTYDSTYIPTEEVQDGDREGRDTSREIAPLEGAPIIKGATGPDPRLVEVAERYAAEKGISLRRQTVYAKVDEARARRIAEAYDAMPHAPQDPRVREAYENLIEQTRAQYDALVGAGYRFYFYDETNDPYDGNPWNAMRDLRANRLMGVFATEAGFGSGATELNVEDNPLLVDTGLTWEYKGEQKRVLANDLFRAVHDAFGHGLEGAGFRAEGEENAWQAHVRLFTGSAIGALTSETRGQNSWLNYGPYGEQNRTAKVEDTVFADQKTGLMPEWTWTEGRVDDEPRFSRRVTETTEFKRWFGDSKVVDENGEPLVVYHGADEQFNVFDPVKAGMGNDRGMRGRGLYFSPNERTAASYGKNVMPVYVSIQNPFTPSDFASKEVIAQRLGIDESIFEYEPGSGFRVYQPYSGTFTSALKEAGYDGVIYPDRQEVIAFHPNQIKSATGNRGTFDSENPDIRFSKKQKPDGRAFTGFFSNITLGFKGAPSGKAFEPVIKPAEEFAQEYNKHRGNFDDHIGSSIPTFRELQTIVGDAIVKTFDRADMLDVGASEGALVKTISKLSGGKIRTVAMDPAPAMEKHFVDGEQVKGSEFVVAAFSDAANAGQQAWVEGPVLTDRDGTESPNPFEGTVIRNFKPTRKFDIIHEAMAFQFINSDRAQQVARIKELMKPGGVVILEEKFIPGPGLSKSQFDANEKQKDVFKEQYFSKEEIDAKAAAVGVKDQAAYKEAQAKKEEQVVGMADLMVAPETLEQELRKNFKHVVQFWDAGNFKGYIASDNRARVDDLLGNMQDVSSEFSNVETPRVIEGKPQFSKRQTETPEFKKWFGDSKVVDENGEPLVVYHGAAADFTTFDAKQLGARDPGFYGRGFYFTPDENDAVSYADSAADDDGTDINLAKVIPAYVSLQNPFIWDMSPDATVTTRESLLNVGVVRSHVRGDSAALGNPDERRKFNEGVRQAGHDGVIVIDEDGFREIVAFKPEQIKSATGNRGTFDPSNPDIRFSKKQPLGFYSELSSQAAKGPGSAMKDQWKGYINGLTNKGVKPDEIEWSGVNDWLDMQTGKVSRDDVLNFLDNNGVQVEEISISDKPYSFPEDKSERLNYLLNKPEGQWDGRGYSGGEPLTEAEQKELDALKVEQTETAKKMQKPKYAQYQLPGGENYREVLLTLPVDGKAAAEARLNRLQQLHDQRDRLLDELEAAKKSGNDTYEMNRQLSNNETQIRLVQRSSGAEMATKYKSSHWDQPNVLAHIRMNDRTDADGNRVLFIEEIQSDWAQEGRKRGFKDRKPLQERRDELAVAMFDKPYSELSERQQQGVDRTVPDHKDTGVPRAPFVTATDKWLSLGIKRIITMAAEGGYDKVAFVNGEQSADRYDLSKQVSRIFYTPKPTPYGDTLYELDVFDKSDKPVMRENAYSIEQIEAAIGKELAEKIANDDYTAKRGEKRTISGLDLKVGGEGMKSFYDVIVPKVVKDVIKKVGKGQIEAVSIPDSNAGRDITAFRIPDNHLWGVYDRHAGQWLSDSTTEEYTRDPDDAELMSEGAAKSLATAINRDAGVFHEQPGFTITEAMRDKVDTTGLPLFSKRQTETPEFKRWFGDSKVVDENGEPLVVYHGTQASFDYFDGERQGESVSGAGGDIGFFFINDPKAASDHSMADWWRDDPAPNVMPVYLSMKNPEILDNISEPSRWYDNYGREATLTAMEAGRDGLIVGDDIKLYVAFDRRQIKSATGNQGTFDPTNPDIRFSRPQRNALNQPAPIVDWSAPEPSKMDTFIYTLQDKHVDTKRVIQAIQETGNQIQDKWDPYLQEGLFHGRSADRVAKFLDGELRPLLTEILARGETMEKVEEFLHNVHAAERNAQIAKVNPTFQGAGSGITDADAAAYLAAIPADRRQRLDALAQRVRNIIHQTQDMLVAGGLETQETINKWRAVYPNYIPLEREDVDFGMGSFGMGTGQGYSTKGSSARRATGSTRPAINIMANIAMQRERAITRVEKNRVALALYGLAVQNPNTNYWLAVNPDMKLTGTGQRALAAELVSIGLNPIDARGIIEEPKQTFIDPVTGLAVQRTNPALRSSDNVISVRINGKDRHLFFNMNDPRAGRMVGALKNMDTHNLGRVLTISGMITRYISSVNTQYNPVFGVVNFTRDVQSAALNLTTTAIAGKEAAVMAHTLPALTGIYRDLRSRRAMRGATNTQWSQLWEEFTAEGGKTGFREQFRTSKDRQDALFTEMNNIHGSIPRKTFNAMFGWLSDYNEAMENAVRLSAYRVALDSGLSKQRAAMLAKNLTVNFNRKGAVSQHMGSMYAFFNASVQGTQRLYETLSGPKGKMIIAGGLLLGTAQAVMLAALGFDEDEPPEFVRERNIIIPLGGEDKKYITVPMPLGFHVIPNISRKLTESWLSGWNKPGDTVLDLIGILFDAFNPIGSAGWSLQTVMPSVVDPAIALLENKDWGGRPIYREKFGGDRDVSPGIDRTKDSASVFSKYLSQYLNYASGGTDYVAGGFSPTPDQIDYLIGQAAGGVGREALKLSQAAESAVTGETLPPYKVPLVGRFYGKATGSASVAAPFYENLDRMTRHRAEIDGRVDDGKPVDDYFKANPEARYAKEAVMAERAVRDNRRALREAVANGDKVRVKEIESRIEDIMTRFNAKVDEGKDYLENRRRVNEMFQ